MQNSLGRDNIEKQDLKLMQQIIELANSGKWEEAVALLSTQDIEDEQLVDSLVVIALYANVEFDILQALLQKGGTLPDNTIVWLVVKNKAKLAEKVTSL